MKYFKFFLFIFVFFVPIVFSSVKSDSLKTAIHFGMKETPEKIFKNTFEVSAKEKDFLYYLKEKREAPTKMEVKNCLKSSVGSVSGYVYNEEGLPLEGIELYLLQKSPYDPAVNINMHYLYNFYSKTDSSGFYSLSFEESGAYVLYASDPLNFYLPQYYDRKNSYEDADILNLEKGENLSGLNFYLAKSASISGKVTDKVTGEGIWGIYIYTINPNYSFDLSTPYFIYSLTDENGNYKLSGLFPGTYELYAVDFGGFYGEDVYPGQVVITGSEDINGIDFELDPATTGIKGKIFLPSGEPAAGAWVEASTHTDFEHFHTITNSKGEYRIGTKEGKYIVGAGTYDFNTLPTYYPGVRNFSDATPVLVEKNKIIENIDFKLLKSAFVEGTVLSSTGNPISSIFVEILDGMGIPVSYDITNEEGKFSIGGLDEGYYFLYAWDWEGNYAPQWYNQKKTYEEADAIFVKGGETTSGIIFKLNTAGKIIGKVIDSQTSASLSDIMIVAYNENLYYESYGFSDEDGNFELKGLGNGSYIIFGFDFYGNYIPTYFDQAISYENATPVTVQEGQEVNITFKMLKGGTIKGYVKSTDNLPISNGFVSAYDLNANWSGFAYTLEDGSYSLGGLNTGSYIIYAVDGYGDYAPKWYPNSDTPENATPVNIQLGEIKENINFYLPPAGTISGKVTDLEGNPLPYFYLFAEKIGADNYFYTDFQWGYTDENGNYVIKGLGTGSYRVGLILSNGIVYYYDGTFNYSEATPVPVVQGEETKNINFSVNPKGGRISGKVIDGQSGEPIAFAYVGIFNEFGIPVSFAFTDESGNYIAYFIEKGKYKVSAWADCYSQEWYREKENFDKANWVYVSESGYVSGIDFTLEPNNCF